MKKVIATLLYGAVLATASLNADLLRVEAGAGVWMQGPGGELTAEDDANNLDGVANFDEDTQNQTYFWMYVKHPIPIVPNVRLEYVKASGEAKATGTFNGFDVPLNTTATTKTELTQIDVIPYYNILDNTFFVTVDLGIDLKILSTDYSADDVTIDGIQNQDYTDSVDTVIPLGYLRARTQIPVIGVGVEADVKYITYGSNTIYDVRAKVDYTMTFIPLIQPGIEVGYRVQKYDINELSNLKLNMDFAGFYAGVMLRF